MHDSSVRGVPDMASLGFSLPLFVSFPSSCSMSLSLSLSFSHFVYLSKSHFCFVSVYLFLFAPLNSIFRSLLFSCCHSLFLSVCLSLSLFFSKYLFFSFSNSLFPSINLFICFSHGFFYQNILGDLHEGAILYNLKQRYFNNMIYVSARYPHANAWHALRSVVSTWVLEITRQI